MLEQHLHVTSAMGGDTPFKGEVPVSELITGAALASAIGLTAGTAQHSNEPWLHFELDGKTLYVAKKTLRHTVSWDQINARGAVFGTATVTIQGDTYKVRLLKGANTDPTPADVGFDMEVCYGSEWNRLMYPLVPNPADTPTHPISQEGIRYGEWADYTETQLDITNKYTWCQETITGNSAQRRSRGYLGVSRLSRNTASAANPGYCWRPVLELVG